MHLDKCLALLALTLLAAMLAGCGGSPSTSTQPTTTGLKKRALVTNQTTGAVIIVDALKDVFSTRAITVFGATKMSTGGGFTAVMTGSSVDVIDNSKEASAHAPGFPDTVTDIAISSDGKTAYAALRNVSLVEIINTADGSFTSISVPTVSRLVLSPNGTKLLAFSDDAQTIPLPNKNAFFVIDTASKTVTPINNPGLDQPFTGVFNGSETQAFILNCGKECGSTSAGPAVASVVRVDFTTPATPAFSAFVPVCGATVGLVTGGSLFVAGTGPTPPAGCPTGGALQAINATTLAVSAPVSITDGRHTKMQTANNRLYIGASTCTTVNDPGTGKVHGCLTIFNTSSSTITIPEFPPLRPNFDVTGMAPITGRTVIYICDGGELDIIDTNTDALTPNQIDVVGKAVDVVLIDP